MSPSAPSPLTPDERPVVARLVDEAPPLTEATKSRLAALLRPSQHDGFTEAMRRSIRGGAA